MESPHRRRPFFTGGRAPDALTCPALPRAALGLLPHARPPALHATHPPPAWASAEPARDLEARAGVLAAAAEPARAGSGTAVDGSATWPTTWTCRCRCWRSDGEGGAPQPVPAHCAPPPAPQRPARLPSLRRCGAPAEWPQPGRDRGQRHFDPCTTFDKWRWLPVVDDQDPRGGRGHHLVLITARRPPRKAVGLGFQASPSEMLRRNNASPSPRDNP